MCCALPPNTLIPEPLPISQAGTLEIFLLILLTRQYLEVCYIFIKRYLKYRFYKKSRNLRDSEPEYHLTQRRQWLKILRGCGLYVLSLIVRFKPKGLRNCNSVPFSLRHRGTAIVPLFASWERSTAIVPLFASGDHVTAIVPLLHRVTALLKYFPFFLSGTALL